MMKDRHRENEGSQETSVCQKISAVLEQDAQALQTKKSRRAFLRFVSSLTLTRLGAAAGIGSFSITSARVIREMLSDPGVDMEKMRRVFGIDVAKPGSVVAAANHPWKPPPDGKSYPNERVCGDAFSARFFPEAHHELLTSDPESRQRDTLYVFGSQVSNRTSRKYLGSPWGEPVPEPMVNQWRAKLRWNLYTPADALIEVRQQYGAVWTTKKHVLIDFNGKELAASDSSDYLLITVLPRHSRNRTERVFILGGIHAPGTRAAELLFSEPSNVTDMQSFFKDVLSFSNPYYYQALFKVMVHKNEFGENMPTALQYVEATPLHIVPTVFAGSAEVKDRRGCGPRLSAMAGSGR